MKNLKEYIIESLFDIEDNIDNIDESIMDQIMRFLKDNFMNASKFKISTKPNKDGKFEVSAVGEVCVRNKHLTSLTNGLFVWTNIKGDFICSNCKSLTSLEGAPKEVSGTFSCIICNALISLKGAPEKVGEDFGCSGCNSLTSLEGAPEKVGGCFYCVNCKSLTSLKGAPKKVGGDFGCGRCNSLKSLKGAPEEVGNDFYCRDCGSKFTREDVQKVSNVKGRIIRV